MREGWTTTLLGNHSEIILGGTPKTKEPSYWNGDIPWASVIDFDVEKHIYKTERSITEIGLNESNTKLLNVSDIVISARGTVGKTVVCGVPMAFNQSSYALRSKSNELDQDFLYYLINHYVIQLQKKATGGVFDTIVTETLKNLEINLPPLPTQRKIASILSVYDDLIENNTRRIAILEEMAQRIYKEWFVDFKYPGHENDKLVDSELGIIPEGWEVGILDDVTNFSNGFAFKSKELLKNDTGDCYHIFKMGQIIKGGGFDSTKTKSYLKKEKCANLGKYILKIGDLLMCMTDMKANVALLGHTALMNEDDKYLQNQRVGLIRANNEININYPFLYLLTNSPFFIDDIRSRANSGVQVNLSTTEIKKTRIIIPPRTINEKFDILGKSIFQLISRHQFKNGNLRQTRDLLLPKLISGKVDVTELDIDIGAEA